MRVLSLAESVGNMGHWYWQTDTDAMTWSDQVYAIFGRSAADYKPVFQSFLAHFQKVDRERVYAQLRQALESQATFEFDARIVASNGQSEISSPRVSPRSTTRPVSSAFSASLPTLRRRSRRCRPFVTKRKCSTSLPAYQG